MNGQKILPGTCLMKRGEVWWINFDPSVGGEIKKIRPAVIVSNDLSNKHMNRLQVVPVTSQVGRCYPCESYVLLKGKPGKAMADQLTTVSKQRFKQKMCTITAKELFSLEEAIKLQLQINQAASEPTTMADESKFLLLYLLICVT